MRSAVLGSGTPRCHVRAPGAAAASSWIALCGRHPGQIYSAQHATWEYGDSADALEVSVTDSFGRSSCALFTGTAWYYARYRPGYPEAFFADLVARFHLDGTGRLLDMGCGTGQLTIPLAQHVAAAIGMVLDDRTDRRLSLLDLTATSPAAGRQAGGFRTRNHRRVACDRPEWTVHRTCRLRSAGGHQGIGAAAARPVTIL
jgi:hypothetical protein